MKTMNYWSNAFAADRAATRDELHSYQNDRETMMAVYNETREIGPKATVEKLIETIGYDRAAATIATMINVIGEWDERIDRRNREWAKTIDDAMDREAAQQYGMYCQLHSCHADQIASEMRRAERPTETVETVEEESVDDAAETEAETVTEAKKATEGESEDDTEKRIEMLAWSIQDAIERENTGAMTDEEIAQIEAEQTEEDATTEGQEATIDRDKIREYIDRIRDHSDFLGHHDYQAEMMRDIAQYIMDEAEIDDGEDRDDFEQRINDDLWCEDSVTGNGSGSYTFSTAKAADNVRGNEILVREMISEFCCDATDVVDRFLHGEWEWFDVSIRCYLLGGVLSEVIDELEETGAIRFAA